MAVGVITGTGTYTLPGFEQPVREEVATRWGTAEVTRGRFAGAEVVHLSRHGEGHVRLSSHVNHRANVVALRELGAQAVLGTTACGAVDPTIAPGTLIVFDDLHFLSNRLSDGSLCSLFDQPGEPGRGHWIYDRPYAPALRAALLEAAREAGHPARDGGVYGHVDGPRFNTATEIRALAAAGVSAVSQTSGPEAVLCGEAEVPYASIGFATDYANDVAEHTPVDELIRLMSASTGIFAAVLGAAIPRIDLASLEPTGILYRFD
jgi:5'-methylthioadenosine phosphorylase